jgi:hypothetical protein
VRSFVPMHVVRAVLPLSMSYLLYMVMGMMSLRGVNLPMYTTLRRTTAAFTMTAEYCVAGNTQVKTLTSRAVCGRCRTLPRCTDGGDGRSLAVPAPRNALMCKSNLGARRE